jgi:hypothetical protein
MFQDSSEAGGYPTNVAARAAALLASSGFEAMLGCLARQILHDDFTLEPTLGGEVPTIALFLATDTAPLREELARRLAEAVKKEQLIDRARPPLMVEVDYFRADLPPAHHVVWTFEMDKVKPVKHCLPMREKIKGGGVIVRLVVLVHG